jgi:hypothetical protein
MRLYSASSLLCALRQWFGGTEPDIHPAADPIDHPDIASMSLLELADLPLRAAQCECSGSPRSPRVPLGEPRRDRLAKSRDSFRIS